jgi:hypothetical protein
LIFLRFNLYFPYIPVRFALCGVSPGTPLVEPLKVCRVFQ